jgi:hypothetical protein
MKLSLLYSKERHRFTFLTSPPPTLYAKEPIGFDETALGREIDQELVKMPWPVAATLPQDGHIRYNMSKGYPWAGGMAVPSRAPFAKLYDDILKTQALWETGKNAVWEGDAK